MNEIKIACAQYPITHFENIEDWIQHTTEWVEEAVAMQAQIVCFPEYGSMELSSLFPNETDPSKQVIAMQHYYSDFTKTFTELAQDNEVIIIAPSFPVKTNNGYVNRVSVFDRKGNAEYQDKIFMTRFESEEWNIVSGEKQLTVFNFEGLKFGIQVCYDSEFPVGSHLLAQNGVELIFVPSCTETLRGATRVHVGSRARAMENQCYVAVSQTIGEAPWSPAVDVNYGYGALYATPDVGQPEDGIYYIGEANEEGWDIYDLDLSALRITRKNPCVYNFKDQQLQPIDHVQKMAIKVVELK